MPKRACPFKDNYAPQLKIHVSEKKQTKTMEKIWNRTQELLFKGGKKQFEENICHNNNEEKKCDFCLTVNLTDIYECKSCNGMFCSSCSLKLYKASLTESVCLSCID